MAAIAGESVALSGVVLEVVEKGHGAPLVFLHAGHPTGRMDVNAPVVAELTKSFQVILPTHPGFGRSDAPVWMNTVDDLAYLYLDLLESLGLKDVTLVGASFGGWIAAEMAVKCTARIGRLVMANPVGIKVGGRETRDIADIYAIFDKEIASLAFADPKLGTPDKATLTDDDYVFMARSREATARYGWSPYLHDPKLLGRLHRIRIPTLVLWGEADRLTSNGYGRSYASAIPGAQFIAVPGAGHFPHIEQPARVAREIAQFARAKETA